mgnify:CR=1 FL=1
MRNTHPTQVPSGATNTAWASIGAGRYHTCAARLDDGTAECWGSNDNNEATPPNGVSFSVISGGQYFTCGTSRDTGFPVCFGYNGDNQVSGAPSTTSLSAIASGSALLRYHNTTRAHVVSCNPLHPPPALQSHRRSLWRARTPFTQTHILAALSPPTTPSCVGALTATIAPPHPSTSSHHHVRYAVPVCTASHAPPIAQHANCTALWQATVVPHGMRRARATRGGARRSATSRRWCASRRRTPRAPAPRTASSSRSRCSEGGGPRRRRSSSAWSAGRA